MSLTKWVVLHSIVAVLAILPSFGVQIATVMGGAAVGDQPIGQFVAILGYIFPFALIGSLLALWLCFALGWKTLAVIFMAAPWVYFAVLAAGVFILMRGGAA